MAIGLPPLRAVALRAEARGAYSPTYKLYELEAAPAGVNRLYLRLALEFEWQT